MEVRRIALPVLFLMSFAACNKQKTVDSVANYKNGSQINSYCPSQGLLKNQFIVKYEDGHMEVIHAENEEVFEEHFLKKHLQEVQRVEYDAVVTLEKPAEIATEATTTTDGDWGDSMIHADAAWQQGIYGQNIVVAVVDTAVDYSHPQLAPRLLRDSSGNMVGKDFLQSPPSRPLADGSVEHGTHVAGIILADPSKGTMSGVAPQAKLLPVGFISSQDGTISQAIDSINYAAQNGAKIINASWGGDSCSESLRETIDSVGRQGVLFVAAAGNDGIDYDQYPAYSYPAVFNLASQITVAATDATDWLTSFSNRSFKLVHIGAPGAEIRSTVPYATDASGYKKLSGTSMATPFVSGAAALLWSAKPNATVAQIKQALLASTDNRSYKVSTQGRLNVEKALDEIRRIVP